MPAPGPKKAFRTPPIRGCRQAHIIFLRIGKGLMLVLTNLKYTVARKAKELKTDFCLWIAWRMPARIAYWVVIRVFAAHLAKHGGKECEDAKAHEILDTWAKAHNVHAG